MRIRTSDQLGAVIRGRRRELGLTQKELAMACGTGLRFIVDLEQGKATCRVGKALDVLHALGLMVRTVPLGSGADDGSEP